MPKPLNISVRCLIFLNDLTMPFMTKPHQPINASGVKHTSLNQDSNNFYSHNNINASTFT